MRHFMKNGEWSMRLTLSELLQSEDIELYAINISGKERERTEEVLNQEAFFAKGRLYLERHRQAPQVKTV